MLFFHNWPLKLELLFFFGVIKLAKDWVIVMSFPIFMVSFYLLSLNLIINFFIMIFLKVVRNDVVLPLILVQKFLVSLHWQPNIPLLKKILRKFLVVDDIICIANGSHFTFWCLFCIRLVWFKVYDIEVFLILDCLFLDKNKNTKWFISDLALLSYVASRALI